MAGGQSDVLRQIHRLFSAGTVAGSTDAELLGRFVATRDALAFEALVERHGPMVLRVCRGVLGGGPDADDAFQATFLVLARKAGSFWVGDSLGCWLFGVARRAATRVRRDAARRSRHERNAADYGRWKHGQAVDPERVDTAAVVVEEIDRLPAPYRSAVVLCYLQGRTYDEAAAELRVSEGTVRGRLARARERLRLRLIGRGVGIPVVVALAGLTDSPASAVPAILAETAVRTAAQAVAQGRVTAGAVSATVAALGDGVLKEMAMSKLKTAAMVLLLASGAVGAASGLLAEPAANTGDSPPTSPPAAAPAENGADAAGRARASGEPALEARPDGTTRVSDEPALVIKEVPKPWETVVRVKVYGKGSVGFCSGTVISSTAGESLILTCGHVFRVDGRKDAPPERYTNPITVDLFDGRLADARPAQVGFLETVAAQMVDYDLDMDVGLLRIRPGRTLPVSPIVPPSWTPQRGMEMVTAGCSEGNDATFWTTTVMKSGLVHLFSDRLHTAIECQFAPKQGRSGGGLFTPGGELAGVFNFAEPRSKHGYYAAPESIYRILDRNALRSRLDVIRPGGETRAGLPDAVTPAGPATDPAVPPAAPAGTPSLADHEKRLREVERKLERLLDERRR